MLLIYILLFVLGLVFGSFIAALTYRIPKGLSNFKGRSFCDRCKKKIYWYDNIPLVSYLFLNGKCRNCDKHISFRYPLIELTTAVAFVLIGFNIYWLLMFLILFSIFIIDFEHQIIPDELVWVGIGLVFLTSGNQHIASSLLAGFFCASILLLIHLVTLGRGMGLGDVKFAILGGMIVGLNFSLAWLILSFLTGGLLAVILILWKVKGLKDKIAFGPFLIIGLLVLHLLSSSSLLPLFLFW